MAAHNSSSQSVICLTRSVDDEESQVTEEYDSIIRQIEATLSGDS